MQLERMTASVESTGKSKPSSEGSCERPDSDSGAGISGRPTHRRKRKRRQRCNKKRHEDSPDMEVPLIIVEVSKDVDEPPKKRS